MNHIAIFTFVALLTAGCSWTYIKAVPESRPNKNTKHAKEVELACTKNVSSYARVGDRFGTFVPVLPAGWGIALAATEKHDQIQKLGLTVGLVSLAAMTPFILSWIHGSTHVNRCLSYESLK